MKIPFHSLKVQTQRVKKTFLPALAKWLDKGRFILDENVEKFEQEWAKFCKAKFAIGVSSGSDALYLALKALGIGPGDEVITQGNAYNASVAAIVRTGATPRFADVEIKTQKIDVKAVRALINEKTKAILVVHLYGLVSSLTTLKAVNIPIIEDCAQSHGTPLQGDLACFSFYPSKSLGGIGDGGAVVTNSAAHERIITAMRNLGQTSKNEHYYFGGTMRLDPIQAIWLRLQLKFLHKDLNEKIRMTQYYDRHLGNIDSYVPKDFYYPHIYPIFSNAKRLKRNRLIMAGVEVAEHYPVIVYKQPWYQGPIDICPNAEWLCEHELSLPLFLGMTRKQQDYIIKIIKK